MYVQIRRETGDKAHSLGSFIYLSKEPSSLRCRNTDNDSKGEIPWLHVSTCQLTLKSM